MVRLKHFALAFASFLLALQSAGGHPRLLQTTTDRAALLRANDADDSLFAQAAAEAWNRDFPSHDISYLLLDARNGQLLASRWNHPDVPIPVGSLLKPFTALAYGELHGGRYPHHVCRGTATGCWLPRGHGAVDLTAAISLSCNSYFRLLTSNLTARDTLSTAAHFDLEAPDPEAAGLQLAGLGDRWRVSPLRLARAYLELNRQRENPSIEAILAGMTQAAEHGTAREVSGDNPGFPMLAKTGTATCTHSPHAPGDGFTVIVVPAETPRILLLVRVHGVPGAQAAKTAGQMLHRIQE